MKTSLFFELLKFVILHPQIGINIIQSALQIHNDSKSDIEVFDIKPLEPSNAIAILFPTLTDSITELNKNILPLQKHLNDFFTKLETEEHPSKKKPYPIDYSLNDSLSLFLYLLCNVTKPNVIVETGVAYGRSSSYILQALHENNKGKLYSIDSVFRPWESKQMIGSVIPNNIKNHWEFIFGTSSHELKKLFNKLGTIDIFFHDSLHTFKNMIFEFETAWPFIKKDGFLISDDIAGNNAFYKFSKSHNIQPIIISSKNSQSLMGVIQKL